MKAFTAGAAAIAVAALWIGPAFAGQTQAEREWTVRVKADPEFGLWQPRPPSETGEVRSDPASPVKPGRPADGKSPTVDIGGTDFRVGIDTGP